MNVERSKLSPTAAVRRFLSEEDEKKVVLILNEQLHRHRRITSDDVRLTVRDVASQGGTVRLPPDFPQSRWVLDFKRVYGFMQYHSFVYNGATSFCRDKVAVVLDRQDTVPLRSAIVATDNQGATARICTSSGYNDTNGEQNNTFGANTVPTRDSSPSSGNASDDEKERGPSDDGVRSIPSDLTRKVVYHMTPSGRRAPSGIGPKRHGQMRHSVNQRDQRHHHQHQRRAMLVDDRRRSAVWSSSDAAAIYEERQPKQVSSGSENGTSTNQTHSRLGEASDLGASHPRPRQSGVSNYESSVDTMQDVDASSLSENRGYKLSHTVPTETWEKAIAAVELQGLSLRAAAKLYGVHFAALHRRVKKRAQNVQEKGIIEYFHPSDEAGIMRVVVARAELGVLMTFAELMRLVEAAALRKLPDLSMDSARKLLTRFQTRNEQSIRHIIDDWPLHWPVVHVPSTPAKAMPQPQHEGQPKLDVLTSRVSPRPSLAESPNRVAMAAAAMTHLLASSSLTTNSCIAETRRPNLMRSKTSNVMLPDAATKEMVSVDPRVRSEGDSDAVMVV